MKRIGMLAAVALATMLVFPPFALAAEEVDKSTRTLAIVLAVGVIALSAIVMTISNRYFKKKRDRAKKYREMKAKSQKKRKR